ncbi:MAG: DUF4412 domain-containing protein [Draconibacterium sp.]
MKRFNHLLLLSILFLLGTVSTSQAQFLDRLKKQVQRQVENTVIDKTADKAAEKTAGAMDKMLSSNPFGPVKGKASPDLIADTYAFSWKYSLKMTTKQGAMTINYYLHPDAEYFGFTTETMGDLFTVMDNGRDLIVMFMQSQGNNMVMASQMPDEMPGDNKNNDAESFNFEKLPAKTINGYNCKGVKATNAEYEMLMYFTDEAEVSFDDLYRNQQTKIPPQLKDYFNEDDKVLMIYMDMNNLKNKKQSAQMECIGLDRVSKTIAKSDYNTM